MLSTLVGQVDVNSAFVLVAIAICICVITTAMIVKHRSRVDVANTFALAKMRLDAEDARNLYALETDRTYRFKQLDQNLITSHKSEG